MGSVHAGIAELFLCRANFLAAFAGGSWLIAIQYKPAVLIVWRNWSKSTGF